MSGILKISLVKHNRNLLDCTRWLSQVNPSESISYEQYLKVNHPHRTHGTAIYGNIYHQYTPNVSIYTIHRSYGIYIRTIFHSSLSLEFRGSNIEPQHIDGFTRRRLRRRRMPSSPRMPSCRWAAKIPESTNQIQPTYLGCNDRTLSLESSFFVTGNHPLLWPNYSG